MMQASHVEIPGRGRRALRADIYAPDPLLSLRSAVILLHGGAWRFGSRADMGPYANILSDLGFLAIAAEYRLLGEAAYPAQLHDVRDVIAWVRSHAGELGIDANKIAVEGFSAGGHLALIAAATAAERPESAVAAVIACFAPPRLDGPAPPGMPSLAEGLLGPAPSAEAIRAASPVHRIGAGFPPTFLLGGMADFLVPPAATLELFHALEAAHADVDLHLYHGHLHEFALLPSMLEPVQAEVALFLKRAVVDPAGHRDENLKLNPFARPGWPGPPPGA
jgi:acetyl esterase/lipase